jgi:nucleotide-binding universal stress UspA family protein
VLRSLLVPLDGSGFSEHSLPLAGKVARLTGASLHLAHVHTPYEPDQLLFTTPFQFEHASVDEYDGRHRDQEERYIAGLADRLSLEGTSVDVKMLDGTEVVDELIEYAEAVNTDMIVMTSHGRSGLRRLWLGSVADDLIQRAARPVIVVHPGEEPTTRVRHILVPLDGSALAESVLGPASELARATGARMTIAQVVPRDALGEASAVSGAGWVDASVAEATRYLEDTAKTLREEGLTVATHVTGGVSPVLAINQMVDELDADFIAMATHGYGGLTRTVLGSVAEHLLRSASVPILVMRPPIAA